EAAPVGRPRRVGRQWITRGALRHRTHLQRRRRRRRGEEHRTRSSIEGAAVLKHHYENFIPNVPGQESAGTPAIYVPAAGYAGEVPFIVDLDPNGLIGHHEETGFQSVGSGAPMAQQAHALLAHFRTTERASAYGMVAALRVLDALDASSPSVGGPMDLCRITSDGA